MNQSEDAHTAFSLVCIGAALFSVGYASVLILLHQ